MSLRWRLLFPVDLLPCMVAWVDVVERCVRWSPCCGLPLADRLLSLAWGVFSSFLFFWGLVQVDGVYLPAWRNRGCGIVSSTLEQVEWAWAGKVEPAL